MAGTRRQWLLVVALAMGTGRAVHGQEWRPASALPGVANGTMAGVAPDQPWPPPEYRLPAGRDPALPTGPGRDPLLEEPGMPPPGWFGNVETGLAKVHFKNGLFNFVPVSPTQTELVHAAGADLDWTVAPRFDVGYRVPRGFGEFFVSYRFLATQGSGDVTTDAGTTALKSHFDMNTIDFVYADRDYPLGYGWEMKWKVGVELDSIYYDSRADLANAAGLLEQRVSNRTIGAGPYGSLELTRQLSDWGLGFYGRVEGAGLYARIKQNFSEAITPGGMAAGLFGANQDAHAQGVGMLRAQGGLSWVPPRLSHSRFFLGYQWGMGWQVGRNDTTGSTADFTENGVFFRGEFSF